MCFNYFMYFVYFRRKKKCIRYKQGEGEGDGEDDNENEDDDSFMSRNRSLDMTLDSSVLSGCDSDSTTHHDSPRPADRHASMDSPHRLALKLSQNKNHSFSDRVDMDSPLSPIIDEENEDRTAFSDVDTQLTKPQVRPLSLVTTSSVTSSPPHKPSSQPNSRPSTSSPRPPPRRLTPHNVDSFLFSPPVPRLPPYGLPPSPLALPMSYIGFPPFQHPISPRTPTSPYSPLDLKPII